MMQEREIDFNLLALSQKKKRMSVDDRVYRLTMYALCLVSFFLAAMAGINIFIVIDPPFKFALLPPSPPSQPFTTQNTWNVVW